MSLDPPTLLWCLAVPAIVALLGSVTSRWISGRVPGQPAVLAEIVLASCQWLGIALAVIGRGHLNSKACPLWSEDAWPTVIWPLLIGVLLVSPRPIARFMDGGLYWIAVAIAAVLGAAIVMPTGDGWTDMLPLHRVWIAGITVSTVLNSYLLHRMAERGAGRWLPLIILTSFGCALVVGAAAYGALFEICLAAIASTAIIAIFAGVGAITTSPSIVFISMLIAASMIAAGRFYSYAEVPALAYGVALFAPSIIAVVDLFIWKRSAWIRVGMAALVALLGLSAVAYSFLVA